MTDSIIIMHSHIQGKNYRAESRLLVFFLYFVIANSLSLIFFTIGSQNVEREQQAFASYFACEALGKDSDNPCPFDVNRQQQQAFTLVSFAMYTIGPYVALVYIVPLDKVKKKLESLKTWTVTNTSTA